MASKRAAKQHINWSGFKFKPSPRKRAISIRIDADVLAYFKAEPGYMTLMNAVLRYYVDSKRGRKARQ